MTEDEANEKIALLTLQVDYLNTRNNFLETDMRKLSLEHAVKLGYIGPKQTVEAAQTYYNYLTKKEA